MAQMVPAGWEQRTGRRGEAKRMAGNALRDGLPAGHTVLVVEGDRRNAVDFVVVSPKGLVFVMVRGGTVDVLSPPGPDTSWTHRDRQGYFVGAVRPEDLRLQSEHFLRRLTSRLPQAGRRSPERLGSGLLYLFPETHAADSPAHPLSAPERRVLYVSDLPRPAPWVDRAAADAPASMELDEAARAEIVEAFGRMSGGSRGGRGFVLGLPVPAAAGIAALLLTAVLFALAG